MTWLSEQLDKLGNFCKLAVTDPKAAAKKVKGKVEKEAQEISVFVDDTKEKAGKKIDTFKKDASDGAKDIAQAVEDGVAEAAKYTSEKIGAVKYNKDDSFIENIGTTAANTGIAVAASPLILLTSCTTIHEPEDRAHDIDTKKVEQDKTESQKAQYRLDTLKNDTAGKYIHQTYTDNIKFDYAVDGQYNPSITLNDGITIKIDHTAITQDMPAETTVKYITSLGEKLVCDGISYKYTTDSSGKAVAEFGNGYKHTIDTSVNITPASTLGTALKMFEDLGLYKADNNALPLKIENTKGSHDKLKGFSIEFTEPKDLNKLVTGNPTVKGSIRDYNFEGVMSKDKNGNIVIKNNNGDEIVIKNVQGYDVGNAQNPKSIDGTVISIKKNGETAFKDTYFMYKFDNNNTNIGTIDQQRGTTFQYYGNQNTTMSTKVITESDKHYHEKEKVLTDTRKQAHDDYYSIVVPKDVYEVTAEAEVNIHRK